MTEALEEMASRNNIGVSLDRKLRVGACGTWWSGSNEGHRIGVLQINPSLVQAVPARERLAAAVTALREANPRGTQRSTELFIDAKRAWLVVGSPPTVVSRSSSNTPVAGTTSVGRGTSDSQFIPFLS